MCVARKKYYALYLLVAFLLSGCGTFPSIGNRINKTMAKVVPFYSFNKTQLESISLHSAVNSNNNLPVALDIVFIFNDEAAQVLSSLSGPDWFANKKSLLLRYQQQLVMTELEVVPHTAEKKLKLPNNYFSAVTVLLFANYLAHDGQYQADISQYHELKITLYKKGYVLEDKGA